MRKIVVLGLAALCALAALGGADTSTSRGSGIDVAVTTADQGYFVLPSGGFPDIGTTTVAVSNVNAVRGIQFTLKERLTVRVTQCYVSTERGSSFFGAGIYTVDKSTLLLETGAIPTDTTGLKKVTLGTAVTLEPAVYWYAWTSNNTSMRLQGHNGTNNVDKLFDDTVDQMGHHPVSGVSGVMPASLGGATGWATFDIPYLLLKP